MTEKGPETEKIVSNSEQETKNIAGNLAKNNSKRTDLICLKGDLGTGKTVFVKGFAEALGANPNIIKSPTYTYVRKYSLPAKDIYHFDYYRLQKLDDLVYEELDEIIQLDDSIVIIEWAEKVKDVLQLKATNILFEVGEKPNQRVITINYP
jgi:tRNA threonylcarbamoyladenosine biosynthesis protein TsaE